MSQLRLTKSQAETWQDMYNLGQTDCRLGHTIFDSPFCVGEDFWLERLAWRTGWQVEKTGKLATVELMIVEEVKHAIQLRVL